MHRATLPVLGAWDEARDVAIRNASAAIRGPLRLLAGSAVIDVLLRTAHTSIGHAVVHVSRAMSVAGRSVLTQSARNSARFLYPFAPHATKRLASDANLAAALAAYQRHIEQSRQMTAHGLGARVNTALHTQFNDMRFSDHHAHDFIDAIGDVFEGNRWQIERLAVTEASWAYNAAQSEVIRNSSADIPDLMSRWTELVNDTTGQPYDNRVAVDSMVLHGQVTPPNGVFTMPSEERAPTKMRGRTWPFPPNRPHDRAVVMPWHRSWGVPGWIYRDGGRVPL